MTHRTECVVYSSFDKGFKIFPPGQLRSEKDALVFVYSDGLLDRLKSWWTQHQLASHGSKVYAVSATPHLGYINGSPHIPTMPVASVNVGFREASVRVVKGFSPITDMEMGVGK